MEENMPDMEQLGKLVQTAKLLGGMLNPPGEGNTDVRCEDIPKASDFDRELQSPAIRSIKAAIPYLDAPYQKNMGIAVKLMELDRLIHHYRVVAAQTGEDKSYAMLMAVKGELPEGVRPAADLLMKLMEIREIVLSMGIKEAEAN